MQLQRENSKDDEQMVNKLKKDKTKPIYGLKNIGIGKTSWPLNKHLQSQH